MVNASSLDKTIRSAISRKRLLRAVITDAFARSNRTTMVCKEASSACSFTSFVELHRRRGGA